jgi:hypothetical protein
MRAMCLVRILGIPGGPGNLSGADGGGVRGGEHVHRPPSMSRTAPWTKAASSEAGQTAAAAIAAG